MATYLIYLVTTDSVDYLGDVECDSISEALLYAESTFDRWESDWFDVVEFDPATTRKGE